MGVTYNNRIVTDGLVLCLDAASKRSYPGTGTAWSDLAGNNNGTLTNGPTFSSDNGGSFTFDGTNDNLTIPIIQSLPDGTEDRTIQFWTKDNSTSDYGVLAEITGYGRDSAGAGRLFMCSVGGSSFANRKMVVWTHSRNAISPFYLIRNEWTNFAVTVSPGTTYPLIRIYKNAVASTGSEHNINTINDVPYAIAGRQSFSYYNGNVSHLTVYNRALSADEIRRNYLSTKERYL